MFGFGWRHGLSNRQSQARLSHDIQSDPFICPRFPAASLGNPFPRPHITSKVVTVFLMLLVVVVTPGTISIIELLCFDFSIWVDNTVVFNKIVVRISFLLLQSSRGKYFLWCA